MRFGRRTEQVGFAVLLVFLASCFLFGGASRSDVTSLVLLQPIAAACLVAFAFFMGPVDWTPVRAPMVLLGALAGIMAIQLIPLPPAVWTNLPGHGPFTATAAAAEMAQPWRPISLSPDQTLASLVGLVVPAAALAGFAALAPGRRTSLILAILIGVAGSALFGLAQLSGGVNSPFYTYKITNEAAAVGLFSNRNHQAFLLAAAWPMLAAFALIPQRNRRRGMAGRWIALSFAIFLLPLLLVTGSRSGLALGVVGLAGAGVMWRINVRAESGQLARWLWVAIGLGALLLITATILLSRAATIDRFLNGQVEPEARLAAAPTLLKMAADFFPVGSGFGTFDPIFRHYEPIGFLSPQYLNHAHNDVLELLITAGLPGALLAIAFLVWFARQAIVAWGRSERPSVDRILSQMSSLVILVFLGASVVDYPLRTPLVMALISFACGWLSRGAATPRRPEGAAS